MLSSNWDYGAQVGIKLDLRYDYINQSQLRSGTSTISPGAASQITNNGNPQEVEKYTVNNYLSASAEYAIDRSWIASLVLPYTFRSHSTLGTASDGTTPGPGGGEYNSNTSNLGDVRLFGRFQGFTETHNLGVLLGLKLPTGSHTLTGTSTDPTAPGPVPIDRGLQPGTGTTDAIIGVYYTAALNKNWDYFGELLYQVALNQSDGYRPGTGANLNLGVRYFGFEILTPQLQLNFRNVQHDTGVNSDPISTGGTLVYLSPGVIVPIGNGFQAYSFVQVPLYQNLSGVQLAPILTASVGARYIF